MSLSVADLRNLPSSYYRVSIKAVVLDDEGKLLVVQAPDGFWEMPGGGWEYDESVEVCLRREFQEEVGVADIEVGEPLCVYRGVNQARGVWMFRVAMRVHLNKPVPLHSSGDDMQLSKFVSKEELLRLPMTPDEVPIKECVDQIWPSVEKIQRKG